ncbi:MAG: hypothetical protein FWE53_00145 [Firmicutes bacterium]|nr:hypothetical protein [Bacillota bacterium]
MTEKEVNDILDGAKHKVWMHQTETERKLASRRIMIRDLELAPCLYGVEYMTARIVEIDKEFGITPPYKFKGVEYFKKLKQAEIDVLKKKLLTAQKENQDEKEIRKLEKQIAEETNFIGCRFGKENGDLD